MNLLIWNTQMICKYNMKWRMEKRKKKQANKQWLRNKIAIEVGLPYTWLTLHLDDLPFDQLTLFFSSLFSFSFHLLFTLSSALSLLFLYSFSILSLLFSLLALLDSHTLYYKVEKIYKLFVAAIATEFSLGCHERWRIFFL